MTAVPDLHTVVLTVGNSMMGDDGAGPLLAKRMLANPIPGWQVINGGSAPENVSHQVRALRPQRLIVVDATDMQLAPGQIRRISPEYIADQFVVTTHTMPLNFLIGQLQEDIAEPIILVGIQPDIVAFYFPMTDVVKSAVQQVYDAFAREDGNFFEAIPELK